MPANCIRKGCGHDLNRHLVPVTLNGHTAGTEAGACQECGCKEFWGQDSENRANMDADLWQRVRDLERDSRQIQSQIRELKSELITRTASRASVNR